jgi:hypothetical protein
MRSRFLGCLPQAPFAKVTVKEAVKKSEPFCQNTCYPYRRSHKPTVSTSNHPALPLKRPLS